MDISINCIELHNQKKKFPRKKTISFSINEYEQEKKKKLLAFIHNKQLKHILTMVFIMGEKKIR